MKNLKLFYLSFILLFVLPLISSSQSLSAPYIYGGCDSICFQFMIDDYEAGAAVVTYWGNGDSTEAEIDVYGS